MARRHDPFASSSLVGDLWPHASEEEREVLEEKAGVLDQARKFHFLFPEPPDPPARSGAVRVLKAILRRMASEGPRKFRVTGRETGTLRPIELDLQVLSDNAECIRWVSGILFRQGLAIVEAIRIELIEPSADVHIRRASTMESAASETASPAPTPSDPARKRGRPVQNGTTLIAAEVGRRLARDEVLPTTAHMRKWLSDKHPDVPTPEYEATRSIIRRTWDQHLKWTCRTGRNPVGRN